MTAANAELAVDPEDGLEDQALGKERVSKVVGDVMRIARGGTV